MFRIFSRDDVQVLRRWITALPYSTDPAEAPAHTLWSDASPPITDFERTKAYVGDAPTSIRDAYRRLLNIETSDAEDRFARSYTDQWLKRAANGVAQGICPLPERWSHGCLKLWLHQRHEASNKTLAENEAVTATREDVIADIISLAPLTMIDGAWLVGCAHPAIASSDWGYLLFETLFDELGNGIHELNHPVIYRDLLRAVLGELPVKTDPSFAGAKCFNDSDFALPVFWLSIGRYPHTYQPEIMGLNLAMELSGVGGGYRQTHRALVTYGFPTLFVDLHNTIDNIATGHSAWAAGSLDAHLSKLTPNSRSAAWQRVRNGFVALNPPKQRNTIDRLKDRVKALI